MNAPTPLHVLAQAGEQGQDIIHESATLHVTGTATYTDDIPELRGTLVRGPHHLARGPRRAAGRRH
jgi:xanthine dehydrogenase large subunit